MRDSKVYTDYCQHCKKIVKNYHADYLVYDRDDINAGPKTPFIAGLGKNGTVLAMMLSSDSNVFPPKGEEVKILFGYGGREKILDNIVGKVEWLKTSNKKDVILYFNGFKIKEVSLDLAGALITSYKIHVLRQWGNSFWSEQQALKHWFEWQCEINGFEGIQDFKNSIGSVYKLGLNPLPKIRQWGVFDGIKLVRLEEHLPEHRDSPNYHIFLDIMENEDGIRFQLWKTGDTDSPDIYITF